MSKRMPKAAPALFLAPVPVLVLVLRLALVLGLGLGCASNGTTGGDQDASTGDDDDASTGDARSGDVGTSGSDAEPGETTFDPVPSELAALAQGLDVVVQGGEADLDGDGLADLRVTVDGEVRKVEHISWGMVVLSVTHRPGSAEVTGDLEADGQPDYRASVVVEANDTAVERHAWDPNQDGVDDHVREIVFDQLGDRSTAHMTITDRILSGDPPALSVRWTRSGRTQEELGDGPCDGMITRPSSGGASRSPLGRPNISVITNGQPGSCSEGDTSKIISALNRALSQGLPCLKDQNPRIFERLVESLAERPLQISCGNACNFDNGTYSMAQTDMGGSWLNIVRDPSMSLNMPHFPSGDCAASIMLHELMHWAGEPHSTDPTGEGGSDQVYACGRFCLNCMTDPACGNGGGDQAYDCAKCADSMLDKSACGTKRDRVLTEDCNYRCAEFEHCGISGSYPASSCMYLVERYCDGTDYEALGSSSWMCIASCPTDFPYDCGLGCKGDDAVEGNEDPCPKPPRCP